MPARRVHQFRCFGLVVSSTIVSVSISATINNINMSFTRARHVHWFLDLGLVVSIGISMIISISTHISSSATKSPDAHRFRG